MANPATAMEIFRPFSILYFENTRNNKFNANKCHNNPPKKVPPPEKYLQTSQPVQREKTGPFKANQWVQRVDNVFPGGSGSENPPCDKKKNQKKTFHQKPKNVWIFITLKIPSSKRKNTIIPKKFRSRQVSGYKKGETGQASGFRG